jgi:3-deoxy-D-manno-octulosonic acid (KDO) 8-phosphate synthase
MNLNDTNVMLTERGTQFGYYDLVVDFRGIVEMKQTDVPCSGEVELRPDYPRRFNLRSKK